MRFVAERNKTNIILRKEYIFAIDNIILCVVLKTTSSNYSPSQTNLILLASTAILCMQNER